MSFGLLSAETMSKEEAAELQELLADLSTCDLTEWEADFVEDMLDRLEKYGRRTMISDRQQEIIDRMKQEHL